MGIKTIFELITERMRLIPGNIDTFKAELKGSEELSMVLGIHVPEGWPSPEVKEMLTGIVNKAETDPEHRIKLMSWYWTVKDDVTGKQVLAGNGGFYGSPDDRELLIGYGMLERFHGKGYGTEAVKAIVCHAFDSFDIDKICADTFPGLAASRRVLEKCGFTLIGAGDDEGSMRYELTEISWRSFYSKG